MKYKVLLKSILAIYTLILVYYSTIAPWSVVVKTASVMGGQLFSFDPGMSFRHMLAYTLEGLLASASLSLLDALFIVVPLGMIDESVQAFIPWRTFDVHDLLANVLGAILGVSLYILISKGGSFEVCSHLRRWTKKRSNDKNS